MDPETLYGVFDAEPEPPSVSVAEPGSGPYGGDVPRPRYNIAPTTTNPVVRLRPAGSGGQGTDSLESDHRPDRADEQASDRPSAPVRRIEQMRWGLVPSWAKDPSVGNRMFNARADSAATKPAFRAALARRRCLVPASGFFEWQKPAARGPGGKSKGPKQPFYITPADGSVMAFAGLWEYWKPRGADESGEAPGGTGREPIVSYTILTTDAVGPMAAIHERMPLVLPASDWATWLDPQVPAEGVAELLEPPALSLVRQLEFRPIDPRVGNVRNDDSHLLDRIEPPEQLVLL